MNLKSKVVSGASWLVAYQVIEQAIGFIRLLVLARFLAPADFGYVGFAWLIMQTVSTFTQPGIQLSLIQKKEKVDEYLDSVWSFLFLRGLVLFAFMFLIAPLISSFFNDNSLVPIIRALSLTFLLESSINIGMTLHQRELNFKKQFVFMIFGLFADFIVAIAFAVVLRNVWAVVLGILANNITKIALSYIVSTYRPKINFAFSKIKELSSFSRWIFFSNILMFIYSQGDDILVGKLLGAMPLGLYQTAYKISNLPTTQVTNIFSSVLFPAYSRVQGDISKVSRIFSKALQVTSLISIYLGSAIIFFAGDFVSLFLGVQWLPMVTALQVLALWGVIRSLGSASGPLWQAIGLPKLTTITQVVQVIVMAVTILPLTIKFGIFGTAWSVVLAALVPNLMTVWFIRKYTKATFSEIMLHLAVPSVSAILAVIFLSQYQKMDIDYGIVSFVFEAMLFSLFYFSIIYINDFVFKLGITRNVSGLISNTPLANFAWWKKVDQTINRRVTNTQ